jgi:hypothetical protein
VFARDLATRAVHSIAQHEETIRRTKAANRNKAAAAKLANGTDPGLIKPESPDGALEPAVAMETDDVSGVQLEDWQVAGGLLVPLQVYHAVATTSRFDFLANAYMGTAPPPR